MTFNTGNPIGSTDARDRSDNSENMDILENSTTLNAHPDRLGTMRKTRKGMELEHDNQISAHEAEHDAQIAAHEAEHDNQMQSFENEFDSRLAGMAFTRVGTFTTGATLTDMRQTLLWEVSQGGDGREYGWTGSFSPSGKVVIAGSNPETTGGIGAGAWVDRTDVTLRAELNVLIKTFSSVENLKLGLTNDNGQITAEQITARDIPAKTHGYYGGWAAKATPLGGAEYILTTLQRVRDTKGDQLWVPDGKVNHYLFDGTDYVAMLHVYDEVDIKQCGAVGDGSTDSTDSIVGAASFCDEHNLRLFVSEGEYQMLKPLVISTTTYGVKGKSRINFPEGFVNDAAISDGGYFAVHNVNYQTAYDESTADTYELHSIHFHVSQVASDTRQAAIVGCSNTNGVKIHDLKVTSEGILTAGARTCLSFYAANKNLSIFDNELDNSTNVNEGGCIWLQGGSGTDVDESGATENVKIYRNLLTQTRGFSADECIAMWGTTGILKNVDCYENTLILDGGGQGITAFTTANPKVTFSRTEGIKIRNNEIKSNLQFNAIRVGGQYLPETIKDVTVESNVINCESPNAASSYGIRMTSGVDFKFKDNVVTNIGATTMAHGINGLSQDSGSIAEGNIVRGNFTYGISNFKTARGNIVDVTDLATGIGIFNSANVTSNEIYAAVTVRNNNDGLVVIEGNTGETPASADSYCIYISGSGSATIKSNSFKCNNANIRPILLQNTGDNIVKGNTFTGEGRQPAGSMKEAGQNWYFQYSDELFSAPFGADLRNALPVGHVLRNSNPTVDANNMINYGWMIYDNAGAKAWLNLYVSNVTPAK